MIGNKKVTGRRGVLKSIGTGMGILIFNNLLASDKKRHLWNMSEIKTLKGNVNHSVCKWCYPDIPLDVFSEKATEIGLRGIDLLNPKEWGIAKRYGLECSMATDSFVSIENGFNDPNNHDYLKERYKILLDEAAASGIQQVIVFSGNRNGLGKEQGLENCAEGLDPLVKYAEKLGVTLVMELLNSKVDHPDYQCDHTEWGIALAKKLDSPNFKLLYDIYHMQIMEGDIISTIRKYSPYISHYHTGGVPGRHEIDSSQELNYPAIIKAIIDTGFKGYIAQEFIPTVANDIKSLQEAITICDL